MAELYLIPNVLSEGDWQNVLPARILNILSTTQYFIVENIRTTRRFLRQVNRDINIDNLHFSELNKHTHHSDIPKFLSPLDQGKNIAIISEAGCPGVADPGASVVKIAHQKGYKVVPLVGPSSIILALMGSGMNGQNFAFNGYLPVKQNERVKKIIQLENISKRIHQTQIFIETPYRNNQLLKDLLKTCASSTRLCIASNLTGTNEFIITQSIKKWKEKLPDLNKQPTIFLIG